ncbi:MAG: hypothetical protein ACUVUD_01265 [bacterium]
MVPVVYYFAELHPDLESDAGRLRADWYGVEPTLLPLTFFDGTGRAPAVTIPDSFYSVYQNMTDGARARKTFLDIKLDSTAVDREQVAIRVRIESTDSTVERMSDLRLVALIYEDSVPYYSLLRGDTVFISRVVRTVVGDGFGVPVHLIFGVSYDTLLLVPIQGWNIDRVGVAVAVQDGATRAVYQSAIKKLVRD